MSDKAYIGIQVDYCMLFQKSKNFKVINMYFKASICKSSFCCNSVTMNAYAMVAYALYLDNPSPTNQSECRYFQLLITEKEQYS